MRNRVGLLVVGVVLAGANAVWAAEAPVAVSPGDASKLALIEARCPTFSWDAVEGAVAHELVVYQVGEDEQDAEPILRQEIPGSGSSWTPPLESCLERGGQYAWSVRTMSEKAPSDWSPPSLFEVAAGPSETEFEAAMAVVRQYLAERDGAAHSTPARTEVGVQASAPGAPAAAAPPVPLAPPAATVFSADGNVDAVSYTGDGTNLAGVALSDDLCRLWAEAGTSPLPARCPRWQPSPLTTWQWQLSGAIDTSFDVAMYDIDLFDSPVATIAELLAAGRAVVCYFSAGSREDWRPDEGDYPPEVLGNLVDGWPGENWVDIRRLDLLGPILTARMDLAVDKGCTGVEPDNVDAYTNDSGFPLTAADQLAFNRFLAAEAHARALSIGLKNDLDQVPDLVAYFDWALDEQCYEYSECDLLQPFIDAGKAVFGVEYTGDENVFCPYFNALDYSWLKKDPELDSWRIDCQDL